MFLSVLLRNELLAQEVSRRGCRANSLDILAGKQSEKIVFLFKWARQVSRVRCIHSPCLCEETEILERTV